MARLSVVLPRFPNEQAINISKKWMEGVEKLKLLIYMCVCVYNYGHISISEWAGDLLCALCCFCYSRAELTQERWMWGGQCLMDNLGRRKAPHAKAIWITVDKMGYLCEQIEQSWDSLPLRRHRLWKFHGAIFRKTTQSQWQKWSAARVLHFQKYLAPNFRERAAVCGPRKAQQGF